MAAISVQLCSAKGEGNKLVRNAEGIGVLLLPSAPEQTDSSGGQGGTDAAPKGTHTRGRVWSWHLNSCSGAMPCGWLFNKRATNLKIMVQLFCFKDSHVPDKGISHVGSSGRIRVRVIMAIELKPVVLQRYFVKCGKQAS